MIVEECKNYLTENGKILFEIGHDQGSAVSELLTAAGFYNVRVIKDLAGKDRVVIGELSVAEESTDCDEF
jgi:release factor glutamine methyltransferase